jgi:hypothetical protein
LVEYAKNYTWERTASAVLKVFESVLVRKTLKPVFDSPVQV